MQKNNLPNPLGISPATQVRQKTSLIRCIISNYMKIFTLQTERIWGAMGRMP
jgi:hypothetical protein